MYTRPRPDQPLLKTADRFFVLPDDYWTAGWFESLALPGRAVLVILLHDTSGRDAAELPYERAAGWYGMSITTLQNGVGELRDAGLLEETREWVPEPLSAIGRTRRTSYSLAGPFSRGARQKLQTKAATGARARSASRRSALGEASAGDEA